MYSKPDGLLWYGKIGFHFLPILELLYPNMKVPIRIIRARPSFYMLSENPNISLVIVVCSLYTRRVMLKEDHHKKLLAQQAYAPVEHNYMQTLAKTYIIPARRNHIIQENIFNNVPLSRTAITVNSNSVFTGSFAEKLIW